MNEAAEHLAKQWVNPWPKSDPRSNLLEYQDECRADKSRFRIDLWSRQTGKDHTASEVAAEDCFAALVDGRNGTQWMVAAPSERQSLETLEKGKAWVEGFGLVIDDYKEMRDGNGSTQQLLKSAEITVCLKNGNTKLVSKLRAVPGRPQTVRGLSANVILTEFDFFEDASATWKAILPSITNPLKGGEKKIRIITTPNGLGGAAHKIWTKKDGKQKWVKRRVTIYDAVRMGLPVDIEELREAFDDPEGWAQEFECEFLDTASVLLGYELLAAIENPMATETCDPSYWAPQQRTHPVDLGIDFGRTKDRTVCWANEDLGGFAMTREVFTLHNTPTHVQFEHLEPRCRAARSVSFDYTGPGIGLGDLLVKEFGEWNPDAHKFGKIKLVTFTNAIKLRIFPALRAKADKRMMGIPVSVAIREDLHSMSRVTTPAGNITYKAPHTVDGHADKCTALALCLDAQERAGTQTDNYRIIQP
jgi:phage FluMu gp28-like protein